MEIQNLKGFNVRVYALCILNNKLLTLKEPFAEKMVTKLPGGGLEFGEGTAECLKREFKEEIGADVLVKELKWVGEIFFPFLGKPCHQICLFYLVELQDESQIPLDGTFLASESFDGQTFDLEFSWIALSGLNSIILYPPIAKELLQKLDGGVEHFVYKEEKN